MNYDALRQIQLDQFTVSQASARYFVAHGHWNKVMLRRRTHFDSFPDSIYTEKLHVAKNSRRRVTASQINSFVALPAISVAKLFSTRRLGISNMYPCNGSGPHHQQQCIFSPSHPNRARLLVCSVERPLSHIVRENPQTRDCHRFTTALLRLKQ